MPFATSRVVAALVLREMTSTYGRRPGGYIWSIVEPIAGIALMTWIFMTVGFRSPALGTNFAIFYATGLLPFYVFVNVSQKVAQSLSYSRQLLAYPRVTVLDALVARYVLNLMTQLLVAYLVLAGLRLLMDTGTQLVPQHVVLGFAMAAALAAGVGTLNCFLMSMFPLWSTAWSVLTRPLLFISGVMFLVDSLAPEWRSYLAWNPLVHIIGEVRSGFYHGYEPSYVSPAYVFGVALVTGLAGLLFLWRFHRDILEA
ncbi:sugar ABC transporter permease [Rubellimicrobium rubrum]|uniref:Transport permease protein n=2 Tax=Rubellimicrobium rubrum TaxID=2585369 RepID=A0A5C4MRD9_9RHOB|nr:sugar ABC transporter permease [Rubellimicrobium rubrum]